MDPNNEDIGSYKNYMYGLMNYSFVHLEKDVVNHLVLKLDSYQGRYWLENFIVRRAFGRAFQYMTDISVITEKESLLLSEINPIRYLSRRFEYCPVVLVFGDSMVDNNRYNKRVYTDMVQSEDIFFKCFNQSSEEARFVLVDNYYADYSDEIIEYLRSFRLLAMWHVVIDVSESFDEVFCASSFEENERAFTTNMSLRIANLAVHFPNVDTVNIPVDGNERTKSFNSVWSKPLLEDVRNVVVRVKLPL